MSDNYKMGLVMKNLFLSYLKDEDGQTSTEYILLVAVVAMIIFKFKDIAQSRLDKLTNGVFDKAQNMLDANN